MNIAQLSTLLKVHYVDGVVEQINYESILVNHFEPAELQWSGKNVTFALHAKSNGSVAAAAEGVTLAQPGSQVYTDLIFTSAYIYGQFVLSGPALAAAKKGGPAAYLSAMDAEMIPLRKDVRLYADTCCFTGGPFIGYVWQKNAALTTMQSSVRFNYANLPGYSPVGYGVKIYRLDTFAEVDANAGRQITAISTEGDFVTVNIAIDTSAVPAEVMLGVVSSAPNLAVESNGMAYNMFSPQWYNITRGTANTEKLNGNYLLANSTTAARDDLTPGNLQALVSKIMFASGETPDALYLSPLQLNSYVALLQGVASGVPNAARLDVKTAAGKGDVGFTSYAYNGMIPFFQGQNCPLGVIYMLRREYWKIATLQDPEFDETTGNILRAPSSQFDSYSGLFKWYFQFATKRPNSSGVIAGISTPLGA